MSETWYFLESSPAGAALNMAIDEALVLNAARRNRPLLRVYSWVRPAVSFGYFQKYPAHLSSSYEIVRRPTGGGLVYHGEDTTYTVVIPRAHRLYKASVADSYRTLHKAVANALESGAAIQAGEPSSPTGQYECFQKPVPGDVVDNGRKLAGGAQRRSQWGILHQGSIALKISAGQLKEGFREALDVEFEPCKLFFEEVALSEQLALEKYATDQWNGKAKFIEREARQRHKVSTLGEPPSGEA